MPKALKMKQEVAPISLTSTQLDRKSDAVWLASDAAACHEFLISLTQGELLALPYLFDFWAFDHQLPPVGDWRNWVILGGRGAGKTRAGSEWVRSMVEGATPMAAGRAHQVALVGQTLDQAREVMVFGDSGILNCSPPDRRPEWISTRRMLIWPNGAQAQVFSASDPEALRGPQFDAAWVDELAKWRKAQDTWDMLQFCLRLGDDPRCCITTTPRNVKLLKDLLDRDSTVKTHAATDANVHLADSFLDEVRTRYAGTSLGRQEIDGELLSDIDGALWTPAMIEATRVDEAPALQRIVVAIDPNVSGKTGADECGIVVAGVSAGDTPQAYVLEDASLKPSKPSDWVQAAVKACERWNADRIVAEVNQGGNMIETLIRQQFPNAPYKPLRASKDKKARAEPIAAYYEQGRVHHLRGLQALEDQMFAMTQYGYSGSGSPDRLDALVWALTELMPVKPVSRPSIMML